MFYGQYAVAGALGGLVSYFVFRLFPGGSLLLPVRFCLSLTCYADPETEVSLRGEKGWYSYQILFLLEGVLTVIVAFTAFFWLPVGPKYAWWLKTSTEREWAEQRVLLDRVLEAERGGEAEEVEELLAEDSDGDQWKRRIIGSRSLTVGGEPGLTKRDVFDAMSDWRIWWLLGCNISSSIPGTAFSVFLPLVVKVCLALPTTAGSI